MTDEIFRFDDDEPEHPTARAWLARIKRGERPTFTLWRKRDGLTFKPAKIYMTFQTQHGEVRESDTWDVDINDALVRAGVQAETLTNEAQRLALMLRYWFTKPEKIFGPGFFEAVLIERVQESAIAEHEALRSVLDRVHVTKSSRDGRSYVMCRAGVETVLRKKAAQSLVRDLRYSEDQAKKILAEALAQYLDERFHVTERRMLGWA
jgi:hypothetical protein